MNTEKDTREQANDKLFDEAEKLIWAALDEQIDEAGVKRLDELLLTSKQVRERYQACAQIHAQLYEHFQFKTQAEGKSPVLTSLGQLGLAAGTQPPVTG